MFDKDLILEKSTVPCKKTGVLVNLPYKPGISNKGFKPPIKISVAI